MGSSARDNAGGGARVTPCRARLIRTPPLHYGADTARVDRRAHRNRPPVSVLALRQFRRDHRIHPARAYPGHRCAPADRHPAPIRRTGVARVNHHPDHAGARDLRTRRVVGALGQPAGRPHPDLPGQLHGTSTICAPGSPRSGQAPISCSTAARSRDGRCSRRGEEAGPPPSLGHRRPTAWVPAGVTGIAQNRFAMAKSARAVPSMLDLVGLTGVGPVSATCEAPGRSSAPSRNGRCEGRRPLRAH